MLVHVGYEPGCAHVGGSAADAATDFVESEDLRNWLRPGVNARIQGTDACLSPSMNSFGASSHACVSHLDAVSSPAYAPTALTIASFYAPSTAAVGCACMWMVRLCILHICHW